MTSSLVDLIGTRINNELHCKIRREWLNDCVKFFKQNEPQISEDKLYKSTLDQLYLETIQNVCSPIIPNEFRTRKDIWTMNQSLFLQMTFIIEISESYYEQWRRLHSMQLDDVKETTESKTFKTKKKRCFKLALYDGSQTIHAMELKPIACLNTKLSPGVKVIIIGPVKVSNKIILLEPNNIKIMGGDVDDLLTDYAYENVLLRQMNRPLTKTPKKDYIEEEQHENPAPSNNTRPAPSAPIDIIRPTSHNAEVDMELKKLSLDEFDMDIDIDFDMLDQIEAQEKEIQRKNSQNDVRQVVVPDQIDLTSYNFTNPHQQPVATKLNKPIAVESYIPRNPTSAFQSVLAQEPPKRPALNKLLTNPWNSAKKSVPPPAEVQTKKLKNATLTDYFAKNAPSGAIEKQIPPKVHSKANDLLIPEGSRMNSSMLHDDFDAFIFGDNGKRKSNEPISPSRNSKAARVESLPKPKATILDDHYKYKIDNTYNFITIDQYKELKTLDKLKRTFAVNASIHKVIKLRVDKTWILEVDIKDEWSKNTIRVKFDDEIVAGFAGRTAKEIMLFHQKLKIQPQLQEDLKCTLEKISCTIQEETFLMTIAMHVLPPNGYEVSVSKIIKNTDDNKNSIKLKIHEEHIRFSS